MACADFELAAEVNTGAYKISAKLGNTTSEKTVTVENYVLPKFGVKLEPEKTFYLPGEQVRGTLQRQLLLRQAGRRRQGAARGLHLRRAAQRRPQARRQDRRAGQLCLRVRPARIPDRQRTGQRRRALLPAGRRHRPDPARRAGQHFAAGLAQPAGDRGRARRRHFPAQRGEHPLRAGQLPGRLPGRGLAGSDIPE